MELLGIAIALFAAWHTTKHGVPRAMRAVGDKRRSSIATWQSTHPSAPKSARWLASAGHTVSALRYGPGYLKRSFADAWREGKQLGEQRYRGIALPEPTVEIPPTVPAEPLPPRPPHQTGPQAPQPKCRNADCFCQGDPSFAGHDPDDAEAATAPERPKPSPRPRHLRPVPPTSEPSKENTDMAIQTATGGEILDAEQFHAEARAIEEEAAAELEDASGDSYRAQEDLGRIEKMVASLGKVQALSKDIAAVNALKEPAEARAQAAKDRQAAAERRLAGAKAVTVIAAKHVQLIGTAAGSFYKAG